jgi:hypothetical protein
VSVPTLRRLNDRERYWGLSWPQWIGAAAAGAVLYGAVKLSPFATKPTITIVLLVIALAAMILAGVSGQALSPLRQLHAITRYRRDPKRWTLPARPDRHGLVLIGRPAPDEDDDRELVDEGLPGELLDEWMADEQLPPVDENEAVGEVVE